MSETDRIYENILTTQEINCSNCNNSNSKFNLDEYQAAEEFLNDGWRATKDSIYCPKCANKKLKPKE